MTNLPTAYLKQREEEQQEVYNRLNMKLPEICAEYLKAKEETIKLSSLIAYARDLLVFSTFVARLLKLENIKDITATEVSAISEAEINEFIIYLRGKPHTSKLQNKSHSLARKLSTVRNFYAYLKEKGIVTENPTDKAEKIEIIKKEYVFHLKDNEVKDLLNTIDNSDVPNSKSRAFCEKTKLRDRAIALLILGGNIRISECAGLDVHDVNLDEGYVSVYNTDGRERMAYLSMEAIDALTDYISEERPEFVSSMEDQALFLSLKKRRMNVRSMQYMLKKYAKEALPTKPRISPDRMRNTYMNNYGLKFEIR